MSAKNRKDAKKIRTLERALRKGRLPAYLNLIHWAKDHGHAQTSGEAVKLIEEDRIMADSHPLGKEIVEFKDGRKVRMINPNVSSSLRSSILVTQPKED